MKQCPVCKNTYTDETLIFCLSDGTRLSDFYEAAATVALPNTVKQTEANYERVNIPVDSVSTETRIISPVISETQTNQTEKKGLSLFAIIALFGLLGIFLLAGIGIGYFFLKNRPVAANVSNNSQNIFPNSNQQKSDSEVNSSQNSVKTARVNSPNDGFLAMRSGASHKTGSQIMKMPHGAIVNVYNCQSPTTIGGKTGRWCLVEYNGNSGWAFDAWLIY